MAGDFSVTNQLQEAAGDFRIGTVQNFGDLMIQLQALEKDNRARLISNPVITTTDNREASILVGQKIPLIVADEAGNAITQLTTIGIMLRVTPHINEQDRITLDIHNEVSDLASQATVQGGVIINTSRVRHAGHGRARRDGDHRRPHPPGREQARQRRPHADGSAAARGAVPPRDQGQRLPRTGDLRHPAHRGRTATSAARS